MYEVFRKLCEGKGVTPYAVCKAIGIRQVTISDWKNGRSIPKQDKMQLIADYFKVPMEYLMTGKMPAAHYGDPETAAIAQAVLENKDLRGLFMAAKDAKPEDIQFVYNALLHLKAKEKGDQN